MSPFIKINATIVSNFVKISVETETNRHRHLTSLPGSCDMYTELGGGVCVEEGRLSDLIFVGVCNGVFRFN